MMPVETMTSANVKQAVPFFGVTNMETSLRFYVGGLGFKMKRWWIPDHVQGDYKTDGRIVWCWLELGEAAIMLQEFMPEWQPKETLGTGVNVCFHCVDALALYREFKSRGIQTRNRPSVGNRFWVVPVTDPDGYRWGLPSLIAQQTTPSILALSVRSLDMNSPTASTA
jgi:lactoylglutathione lyase